LIEAHLESREILSQTSAGQQAEEEARLPLPNSLLNRLCEAVG